MIGKEMKEPREMMSMMKDMIADSLGSFLFHLFSLGSWLVIPFVLHSPLASQTGGRSRLHDPLRSLPSLRRSDRVAPGGLPPAAPTERVKG